MSGPSNGTTKPGGPSSSKAPALRHNATAAERQAAAVQKLLANPDKPVHIPERSGDGVLKQLRPPREMMKNVQGSSAGAGSGEFHVYKQARRREYERLKLMDEEERLAKEKAEAEQRQIANAAAVEAKTAKNRLKRQRKKQHRKGSKQKDGADDSAGLDREESSDEEAAAATGGGGESVTGDKKRKLASSGAVMRFKTAEERDLNDEANGQDAPAANGSVRAEAIQLQAQQEAAAPAKEAGIVIQDDD